MLKTTRTIILSIFLMNASLALGYEETVINRSGHELNVAMMISSTYCAVDSLVGQDCAQYGTKYKYKAWYTLANNQSKTFKNNGIACTAAIWQGKDFVVTTEQSGVIITGKKRYLWAHPTRESLVEWTVNGDREYISIRIGGNTRDAKRDSKAVKTDEEAAAFMKKNGLKPYKCILNVKNNGQVTL